MAFLLDTNVLIHASKNAGKVRVHLQRHKPGILYVSVVSLAELMFGASKTANPDRSKSLWLEVLAAFAMLDFDASSAHQHARLRALLRHQPIGERDLLIAAIACSRDLTVVSHNLSEFGRVPGLACQDWYV